jgi:hypothetical protein
MVQGAVRQVLRARDAGEDVATGAVRRAEELA